MMPFVNNALF